MNNKTNTIMLIIYSIFLVVLFILDILMSTNPFYTLLLEEPSICLTIIILFLVPFILFAFNKINNNNKLFNLITIFEIILIVLGLFWFIWPLFHHTISAGFIIM